MHDEKLHIIPHNHSITVKDRRIMHHHNSFVIWFVGLSGSGKSTIANALETKLFNEKVSTYILDGDNVRTGLNKDLDFSDKSRIENIRRVGEVAKLMVDAGKIVLSAFISPFNEERNKVKEIIGEENYFEIFVNCPLEICEERDVKGLYKKARSGEISNFTGISSAFEKPVSPNLEILSAEMTVDEAVDIIYLAVIEKIKNY